MAILELMPGEGGADSELFMEELARAIAKHAGAEVQRSGKNILLHRL